MQCINKLYLCVCWWGKGWPVVACPSRALVVLYRMLTIFACYVLTYVWDAVSILTTSLGCFFHGICFSNNGLNKLPWTSYLHVILRIISRDVSVLATDFPCGVWGRGWTTCLLHDSPLFGSQNESWYISLEWDFIYLLSFFASVHGFMHEISDFFTLW